MPDTAPCCLVTHMFTVHAPSGFLYYISTVWTLKIYNCMEEHEIEETDQYERHGYSLSTWVGRTDNFFSCSRVDATLKHTPTQVMQSDIDTTLMQYSSPAAYSRWTRVLVFRTRTSTWSRGTWLWILWTRTCAWTRNLLALLTQHWVTWN